LLPPKTIILVFRAHQTRRSGWLLRLGFNEVTQFLSKSEVSVFSSPYFFHRLNEWSLKHTWFLYVLSKYQRMFKVLQWNARLWKTPTLKIAPSSPEIHDLFDFWYFSATFNNISAISWRLRTYTKVVPFKENRSFRYIVLWKILNGME
jgi:hypothetical protein